MEWVIRCVLMIHLVIIDMRLVTATPVLAKVSKFSGQGSCEILNTTVTSTVNRPADCRKMLVRHVNILNPSQDLFDNITDGLDLLQVLRSNIRLVYLSPNLISLFLHVNEEAKTELVIDNKLVYKLQKLTLSELDRFPANLDSLQSLKVFHSRNMPAANINFTIFSKMVQLEEIILTNIGSVTISNSLQLSSLRKLEIWNSLIETLNGTSSTFPNLEWLYLFNNSIQILPEFVSSSTTLQFLTIQRNQLGRITFDDFAHLKQLKGLTLTDCQISEVSTNDIVHLPSLYVLHFDRNKLTQLNVQLWNLPALLSLTLQNNQLKEIAGVLQLQASKSLDRVLMFGNPCDCQWLTAVRKQFPVVKWLSSEPCYS